VANMIYNINSLMWQQLLRYSFARVAAASCTAASRDSSIDSGRPKASLSAPCSSASRSVWSCGRNVRPAATAFSLLIMNRSCPEAFSALPEAPVHRGRSVNGAIPSSCSRQKSQTGTRQTEAAIN
jgi:hypothetical protein